jgi:hypothetical protein
MPAELEPVDAYVFMHLIEPVPNLDEGKTQIGELLRRFRESKEFRDDYEGYEGTRIGVRWAQQMVGSYVVFGAVTAPSLEVLESWIAKEFWDAGVRSEWSVADRPSRYRAPYKHSPPYYAFVRVRARGNPRDVLAALDTSMDEKILPLIEQYEADDQYGQGGWRDHFDYRAATVSGKGFDILVELAAFSIEELTETILTFIGRTEGVVSTDTAYSYVTE